MDVIIDKGCGTDVHKETVVAYSDRVNILNVKLLERNTIR